MAKARASKAKAKPKARAAKSKARAKATPKAKPTTSAKAKPKPRAKKPVPTPEEVAEAAALRAAILSDPDDEAARLVYADWLTERGDPRGAFIVTGLELARLQALDDTVGLDAATSKQHDDHVDRLIALEKRHGDRFCDPAVLPYLATNAYERGFVENLEMSVEAFVADGARVLAAEPIRSVKIEFRSAELPALAAAPAIAKVPGLSFHSVQQLAPFFAAKPDLASLRRLDIMSATDSGAVWREAFSQLAAPRLERIELLVVHGVIGLYDGIAMNPHLQRSLKHLVVGQSFVHRWDEDEPPPPESRTLDEVVGQLAALPLETLRFTHDDATLADATIATLFADTAATNLRRAKLDAQTDAAALAIARSPRAKQLQRLQLTIPGLTAVGVRALLEGLPALTYLGLDRDKKADAFEELAPLLLALSESHPLRVVDVGGLALDRDARDDLAARFILANSF